MCEWMLFIQGLNWHLANIWYDAINWSQSGFDLKLIFIGIEFLTDWFEIGLIYLISGLATWIDCWLENERGQYINNHKQVLCICREFVSEYECGLCWTWRRWWKPLSETQRNLFRWQELKRKMEEEDLFDLPGEILFDATWSDFMEDKIDIKSWGCRRGWLHWCQWYLLTITAMMTILIMIMRVIMMTIDNIGTQEPAGLRLPHILA